MNNSYYYQLLADFTLHNNRFNFSRFFRDAAKKGDIENVDEMFDRIKSEITEGGIQDAGGVEYFLFMAETGLLFSMYREDQDGFDEVKEAIGRGFTVMRQARVFNDEMAEWESYFEYINHAQLRLSRSVSIETFEKEIDEIDWDEVSKEFIYRISGITGFVYLNESGKDKFNKARFWLQRAVADTSVENALHFHMNLVEYFLQSRNGNGMKQIEELIDSLENKSTGIQDNSLRNLMKAAVLDLKARALIFKFALYDDDQVKIEENLGFIRDLETNVNYDGKDAPAFTKAFLKAEFAKYYQRLSRLQLDQEDLEDLLALAHENVKSATATGRGMSDSLFVANMKLVWLSVVNHALSSTPEKDLKEAYQTLKKSSNKRIVLKATQEWANYFILRDDLEKAYNLLLAMFKTGMRDIENGGFYLTVNAFRMINDILLLEAEKPGVSWMVNELVEFHELLQEVIDSLVEWYPATGREAFDIFRNEFARFRPVSHYNILTYYRYQWYSIKVMKVSSEINGDEIATMIAENLLREMDNETNPMSFIRANWEEFKDVPNFVRNTTINKCITISKGDLPLAAEHLDFSYRNLRSYITFKEVNRLGNFLDERRTSNKHLEEGIRLMFHDLYKDGTIFEVVFDMPRFLVEFAQSGFSSQDLEESLNIKGTTAKKYIKIMIETGLIKLEKSVGRKHFYKLRRDNVMNRLGKEKTVLVG